MKLSYLKNQSDSERDTEDGYTLKLKFRQEFDNDVVQIAMNFPYVFTDLALFITNYKLKSMKQDYSYSLN